MKTIKLILALQAFMVTACHLCATELYSTETNALLEDLTSEKKCAALDEASHSFTTDAAYLYLMAEALTASGKDTIASQYETASDQALALAISYAELTRDPAMATKVVKSRLEMAIVAMNDEIGKDWSNMAILMRAHGEAAKQNLETPDAVVVRAINNQLSPISGSQAKTAENTQPRLRSLNNYAPKPDREVILSASAQGLISGVRLRAERVGPSLILDDEAFNALSSVSQRKWISDYGDLIAYAFAVLVKVGRVSEVYGPNEISRNGEQMGTNRIIQLYTLYPGTFDEKSAATYRTLAAFEKYREEVEPIAMELTPAEMPVVAGEIMRAVQIP